MLLNEVSEYAPKKLREMEETFSILKKSSNNKNARIKLLQQVKDFTKIHDVAIFVNDELNLGVITRYKNSELISIIKSFFTMMSEERPPLLNKTLRKLESVEESPDQIEMIYLFIGKPLLKLLTPQELVAVLLHEFGHVFSTTSSLPGNILLLLKTIMIKPIKDFGSSSDAIISKLIFLYTMVVSIFIHGITFTQHVGEYQADNFSLKYGYGDELVTALNKFRSIVKIKKSNKEKAKSLIKKITDTFIKIFTLSKTEISGIPHPETDARIEKLEKQIFDEYKKTYPNYKEVFDLIRADYKAREALSK